MNLRVYRFFYAFFNKAYYFYRTYMVTIFIEKFIRRKISVNSRQL